MELSSSISYSLNNHLVISVDSYLLRRNFHNGHVYRMKVMIVGEMDEQTGEHILADPDTTPKKKKKGYVIYHPIETLFYVIFQTPTRGLEIWRTESYF